MCLLCWAIYIDFLLVLENIIGEVGVCIMAKKTIGSRYTEDWIPVKSIVNGTIQLDDGNYVTGVKVEPKNIFILAQEQENGTIYGLRNFYNMLDYEFWLVSADRPVDINVYLSELQIAYSKANSGAIRKLIMQDINKANAFMSSEYNVVDTEYFILFKEKRTELVQKKMHNLISSLANCGINSKQVSNDDMRVLLDNFLNGGSGSMFGTVIPA